MASVQVSTTSTTAPWSQNTTPIVQTASGRLWLIAQDGGSGTPASENAWYSDNSGTSWTNHATVDSTTSDRPTLLLWSNAGTATLTLINSGMNSSTNALIIRHLSSNVDTGVPGVWGSSANIDAGGAGAGVSTISAWIHNPGGAANPRFYLVGRKLTASSVYENRVWYGNLSTSPTWATLNDVGSQTGSVSTKFGCGDDMVIGGVQKGLLVVSATQAATTDAYLAYVFDPDAAPPALGASTATITPGGVGVFNSTQPTTDGILCSLEVHTDYAVFGSVRQGASPTAWDFYKTVAGTSFAQPSGWSGLTMGRAQVLSYGSDFVVAHNASYAAVATSSALSYRTITASSDAMAAAVGMSDANGQAITGLVNGTTLYLAYRSDAASPYGIRTDPVTLPTLALPVPANLHTTAVADTTADLAWDAVTGATGYKVMVTGA